MGDLDGKVAIVTGAAGGIGAGIVKRVAEAGAKLVLTDYDAERLAAAEETAIADADAGRIAAIGADLTKEAEVAALIDGATERFGQVDILVNNAGVLRTGPVVDISLQEWNLVLASNLTSAFLCSKAVLPAMIERGDGAIVNIASVAAFAFTTPHAHYAASKAGMVALSRDLSYEVAPHGIRVNAIAPSGITSPMNQKELPAGPRKALESAIALDRWGAPEDIGDAVVYLASDKASFVVGAVLGVTGGSDLCILHQS
jgi:NAD(P)-dependent dehydrogenase (short-subunit alcohol dehydrogenase family)